MDYKPEKQDRTAINHLKSLLPRLSRSNGAGAPASIELLLKESPIECAFVIG